MASLARSCHFSARTVATSNAANYTSTLSPSWQSVNVYGTINEDLEIAHFPFVFRRGNRFSARSRFECEIQYQSNLEPKRQRLAQASANRSPAVGPSQRQ